MKYYDISVPLSNKMHIWPSNSSIDISLAKSIEKGASSTVTNLKINTHTGTHVDSASHMLAGGTTVDRIPLETLIGEAQVIDIDDDNRITEAEVKHKLKDGAIRVLFKTKNSKRWTEKKFFSDFVYLTQECADFLVLKNVKLVAIDYLSLDKYGDKNHGPHKKLMSKNIVIIEGANLSDVPSGEYELFCLPLRVMNADGAPARVVLRG